MKHILLLLLVSLLFLSSFGCVTAYKVAVDEHSIETQTNDEIITAEIKAGFLLDELVKYTDFDAAIYDGHAYIIGEYESQAQVDRATQIARSVKGIRTLTTYMLPKQNDDLCDTSDNLLIYSKVKQALINDGDVHSTNVNTKVIQCNVVLIGILSSQAEINRAVVHAKDVEGVRSVQSFLRTIR